MSDSEQVVSDTEVNGEEAEKKECLFDDEQMQLEISCKTNDDALVPVRVSHLLQSSVFMNMCKDTIMSPKDLEGFEFNVSIDSKTFMKVVEWMGEHIGKADPKIEDDPATRQRKALTFSEYETEFFNKANAEDIASLIKAANYLDIKSLYYYGCQSMANLIGNKTPEELRELFGLEDDLTEEEKADIRRRNMWCNY